MFKTILAALVFAAAALALTPSIVTAQQQPGASPAPSATPSVMPSASPSPLPSPTPSLTPMPVATPLPTVTPLPTATPLPTPTPTPLPTATPLPTPLALPPDAAPQILAVTVSDPVFHSGETVSGTVITSTNVAAVELHLAGRSVRMARTDFGVWQLSYTVPSIPFWLRKNYTVQVVAVNSSGAAAEKDVTIALR